MEGFELRGLTLEEINMAYPGQYVQALEHAFAAKDAELAEARAEVERLKGAMSEVDKEAGRTRLLLLLNHGHTGQYLDDGEMQCGQCRGDYNFKSPPLSDLTKRVLTILNNEIAALRKRCEEAEEKLAQSHDWYCGCGHWNGPDLAFCAMCRRDPRGKYEGEM